MIIALFPNKKKIHSFDLAKGICKYLHKKNIKVVVEDDKADAIGAEKISTINRENIDFLISMGGDGTILKLFHQYFDTDSAILGINLGHLGFMADIPIPDVYPSLEDLIEGKYAIEERLVIEGENKQKETFYSVNDIVIHRGGHNSLVEIAIYVDDKYLNTFIADGVIIASPNGSTAYSLAAGGPILSPKLDAFLITPICAHTISNRPFVITANHTLKVQYLSKHPTIEMHVDGIDSRALNTTDAIYIRKSSKTFKLVNLDRHDYYTTLRTKLNWSGKLH